MLPCRRFQNLFALQQFDIPKLIEAIERKQRQAPYRQDIIDCLPECSPAGTLFCKNSFKNYLNCFDLLSTSTTELITNKILPIQMRNCYNLSSNIVVKSINSICIYEAITDPKSCFHTFLNFP